MASCRKNTHKLNQFIKVHSTNLLPFHPEPSGCMAYNKEIRFSDKIKGRQLINQALIVKNKRGYKYILTLKLYTYSG